MIPMYPLNQISRKATFLLKDVWYEESYFYDLLMNVYKDTDNWAYFLTEPSCNKIVNLAIARIFAKYKNNYAESHNKDDFAEDFLDFFVESFPKYLNRLKGDLSKAVNIEDIGTYTFKGETPTKIATNEKTAFDTPKQQKEYNFEQKSDELLVAALGARTQPWREWVALFAHFFQENKIINVKSLTTGDPYEQLATNTDAIADLQETDVIHTENIALTNQDISAQQIQINATSEVVNTHTENITTNTADIATKVSQTELDERIEFDDYNYTHFGKKSAKLDTYFSSIGVNIEGISFKYFWLEVTNKADVNSIGQIKIHTDEISTLFYDETIYNYVAHHYYPSTYYEAEFKKRDNLIKNLTARIKKLEGIK